MISNWPPFIMPFGKYEGHTLCCVPTSYLRWLVSVNVFAGLAQDELSRRHPTSGPDDDDYFMDGEDDYFDPYSDMCSDIF